MGFQWATIVIGSFSRSMWPKSGRFCTGLIYWSRYETTISFNMATIVENDMNKSRGPSTTMNIKATKCPKYVPTSFLFCNI